MERLRAAQALLSALLLTTLVQSIDGCKPSINGGRALQSVDGSEQLNIAARAFCEKYSLSERKQPVKIYDLFMFNDELDMLEIRLTTLYDVVDYIVIVESKYTHQDKPKPLHYQDNKQRYAKWSDKIVPIVIDRLLGPDSFNKEWYHREMQFAAGLHVKGREAQRGDLIIQGDVDEIPRPEAVQALRSCEWVHKEGYDDCAVLEGPFFYFSYSWYAGTWSPGPRVFIHDVRDTMGGMNTNSMRYHANCTLFMHDASWHCTDCFPTIRAVRNKISAFCHAEKDRYPYNETEFIVDRAVRGLNLFEPDKEKAQLRKVPYCENAPPAVLANPTKYHYLLTRDPVTGSFSDYEEYLGDRKDVVGNFHGHWNEWGKPWTV